MHLNFDGVEGVIASMFDQADAMLAIIDQEGAIHYANPAFYQQCLSEGQEVRGQNIYQLFARFEAHETFDECQRALAARKKWRGVHEFNAFGPQKRKAWIRFSMTPDFNCPGDQAPKSFWALFDETDKYITQKRKVQLDEQLNSILDNIPAYVFLKNRDGQYTYANKMLERLHARSIGEILGKTDAELFDPDGAKNFARADKQVFEQGKTVHAVEYTGCDEYGVQRCYLSVKCPLGEQDGQVQQLLGMAVDITEQSRLEKALKASEERLNGILNNIKARVYIKDLKGCYLYANQELCAALGTDEVNIIGKTDADLFDAQTAAMFIKNDTLVFEKKERITCLEKSYFGAREGEGIYFWSVKVPQFNEKGEVTSLIGISTDMTAQKKMEEALRANENRLNTILDSLKAHVFIKDQESRYTYVNTEFANYVQRKKEEIIGLRDNDLFGPTAAEFFSQGDQEVLQKQAPVSVLEGSHLYDGEEEAYFWTVKVPLQNNSGSFASILGVSTDITDQKKMEEELRRLAATDPLTGISNRRHFWENFRREIRRSSRYEHDITVLLLDIDHFKKINDTFGHSTGDEALIGLVQTAGDALRGTDIFGRVGGEEFAILLPETDVKGGERLAERIRTRIEQQPFKSGEEVDLSVTVSIGVATLRRDEHDNADDVMKRADEALYAAKRAGRNRVHVSL